MTDTLVRTAAKVMDFNTALGFTVAQYLFALEITRVNLGKVLGCSGPNISNRLKGKVTWPAEDVPIMADFFGLEITDLMPIRSETGGWLPAPFIPGKAKGPVLNEDQALLSRSGGGARTRDLTIMSRTL